MSEVVTQNEGAFTIAGTQVSLDSVVYSYKAGESPETIQRSFPILTLAQTHDAIAYYLNHVSEVDQYLINGEREFEKLKRASREEHLEWYEKLERARKETPSFLEDKTCFQGDVNLNENIITRVCQQAPQIDFQTAHDAGIQGQNGSQVLHLAASNKRIVVTQDQRTMPKQFKDFMQLRNSLGVLIISQKSEIKKAIEELILIWKGFDSWNHVEKILYLDV